MYLMLQVQNLTKYYDEEGQRVYALKDLTFEVKLGDSLAICGPSGAGKTTLLSLLGGLDKPSLGQIFVYGRELNSLDDKEEAYFRNAHLGFVFQFHHLLDDFTILENVILPLLIQKIPFGEARERGLALLDKVGISGLSERHPKEISGGEQQRAAIARALIARPKLILADEPTGNLDENNGQAVFELLCKLNRDLNSTLIVVTHHQQFAKKLNHIMVLDNGMMGSFKTNKIQEGNA